VWIEKLTPISSTTNSLLGAADPQAGGAVAPASRSGGKRARKAPAVAFTNTPTADALLLTCRAVNMSKIKPTANASIAYAIDSELKSRTNLFATNGVTLGNISEDPLTVTVDFTVKLNPEAIR